MNNKVFKKKTIRDILEYDLFRSIEDCETFDDMFKLLHEKKLEFIAKGFYDLKLEFIHDYDETISMKIQIYDSSADDTDKSVSIKEYNSEGLSYEG